MSIYSSGGFYLKGFPMAANSESQGLEEAIFQWVEVECVAVEKVAEELGISEAEVLAACETARAAVPRREQSEPRDLVLREFDLLDRRLAFLYRTTIAAWRDSAANEKSGGSQTQYLTAAARIAKEMAKGSVALAKLRTAWEMEDQQKAKEGQTACDPPASGFARSNVPVALERPIATESGDGSDDEYVSCDDAVTLLPGAERRNAHDFAPLRAADSRNVSRSTTTPKHSPGRSRRRLKSTA
jgi:hypothetical protein